MKHLVVPSLIRRLVTCGVFQGPSTQKRCLILCLAFALLFLVFSTFYHEPKYTCKGGKYTAGTGSIYRHQSQFDAPLFTYLQNQEAEKVNSNLPDWMRVLPHVFAYSAYISESAVPENIKTRYYIKILTVVLPSLPELQFTPTKLSCILNFSDGRLITTAAYLSILPEHHFKCYRAAFITCPVTTHAIPARVSLTYNNSSPKWVKVQSALLPQGRSLPNEISICVRPLFGPYNSIIQLAEFVGYYQSMGITRFLFYNYSMSSEVSKYLQALSKNTVVKIDILPWSLSIINMDGYLLHAFGQIVFNQDCILRLTSDSRYVGIVDLDEFIMPQESLNLGQVLRGLEAENPLAGSFLFSSIMFCEELLPKFWDNRSWPLLTQTVVKRQKSPWIHTHRSKYVVMPQRITVAMIHEIKEHVEPFYSVNVSPSTVLLYHCRECCGLIQPYFYGFLEFETFGGDTFVEDKRLRKIGKLLNESISIRLLYSMYSEAKIV